MITITDITRRIQVQAQGTASADDPKNLADYVWMLKHHGAPTSPNEVWEKLRQDFEDLNLVLNNRSEFSLGRSLAYAINGLLLHCIDHAAARDCDQGARLQMLVLAWRINCAWDAILAGDVESIREHVELEERAKTIG